MQLVVRLCLFAFLFGVCRAQLNIVVQIAGRAGVTQTSAVVGGRVRVECFVENLQGDETVQSISWTHDGDNVVADGNRISVEANNVTVNSMLEIDDAVIGDAGVYECTVRFTQPQALELNGSVSIAIETVLIVEADPEQEAIEGETAVLLCNASSSDPPTITWFRMENGTKTEIIDQDFGDPSFGNLTIPNVNRDQAGTYICEGSNQSGPKDVEIELVVLTPEAPAINMTQAFNGTAVPVNCRREGLILSEPPGESAVIQFIVTGDPCPNVTWSYNGSEIEFNENNTLHLLGNDPCPAAEEESPSFTFNLTVANVTEGEGLYYAVFENNAGNTTSDKIMVVPEAMAVVVSIGLVDEPCLRGNTTEPLRIKCETSGYPEPDIAFFKGTNSPVDVTTNTSGFTLECDELVIANVTNDDGGTYGCSANNGAGDSATVEFTAVYCNTPTVVSVVPDKNPLAEGDTLVITCSTSGTPPPEVVWQRVEGNVVTGNISDTERVVSSGSHPTFQLYINNTEPNDAGVYRCLAFNLAGEDSGEIMIQIEVEGPTATIEATPAPGPTTDNEDLSTGAIVGIAMGTVFATLLILVFVAVVVVVIVMVTQRRRSQVKGQLDNQGQSRDIALKENEYGTKTTVTPREPTQSGVEGEATPQ